MLQVHRELVFQAPPEETQKLAAMVKQEMEQVYPLAVPLVADIGAGRIGGMRSEDFQSVSIAYATPKTGGLLLTRCRGTLMK